ncbi:hypothetical protein Y032_0171g299 [Ancylostoma ceylanicum]|uniref:DDE-1 domain-containing protein n=1 Tax=Ancylostoma ceylanicum TaxID=53326 RepID=A0A016SUQ1_9BILA|nr:hypothetical protein Y032_0171g299 [Ancylostoma ceylanicum]
MLFSLYGFFAILLVLTVLLGSHIQLDYSWKEECAHRFLVVDGPILWKLVPQAKSIDADYVCQELEEMVFNAEHCTRKRDQISLLWDNCCPHFAKKTQENWNSRNWKFSHSLHIAPTLLL